MRRRHGLSVGTVLVLLLCTAAVVGFFAFVRTLGGDSPAAAMDLTELAESVSNVFATPRPSPQPGAPEAQTGAPMVVAESPTEAPFRARDPISLMMTLGGLVRFDSDITASITYQDDGGALLRALSRQLPSDLTVLGFDHVIAQEPPRNSDSVVTAETLNVLKGAGVNALVLPGISGQDLGLQAALDTAEAVGKAGLRPLGMGQLEAARLQVNGLNIAWLHVGDKVSSAGQRAVSEEERAVLLTARELGALEEKVSRLRETSDLVIVSVAWDGGSRQSPTAQQSTFAHRLAQAGADMVLGYGGQQVQQVEVYQLPDPLGGQRDVLIAYSLGTLLTENRASREMTAGTLLHVDMLVRPEVHGVQFVGLRYTPTFTRRWLEKNSTHFAVLPSIIEPPEGMTRTQRESMEEARRMIEQVFRSTQVTLQR